MMITRRAAWSGMAAAAYAVAARPSLADECLAFDSERQAALTPAQAIERLRQGNERFLSDAAWRCDLLAQVQQTSSTQAPFAAILGCMDSRVPPELVFDQRIGDVFVVRIAGNFVDDDILGSLEYATAVVGSRAVVVLGHSSCGAVKGAIDGVELGHITGLLDHLEPAVAAIAPEGGDSHDHALVQAVAEENVRLTVAAIGRRSPLMAERIAAGELAVVGAMHDVATGQVTFL